MALILHIDTALETAMVGLTKDGVLLDTLENTNQQTHASFVQPAIKTITENLGYSLQQVDAIAVTLGPGSYTGVRVGLASAKGLCFALDKPLIGINTLQVMTQQVILDTKTTNENVLFSPMIDARRMEVFTALYNSSLQEIVATTAIEVNANTWESYAVTSDILCFGNGSEKFKQLTNEAAVRFVALNNYNSAFALLADNYFLQENFISVADSVPVYGKQVYTTTPKKS